MAITGWLNSLTEFHGGNPVVASEVNSNFRQLNEAIDTRQIQGSQLRLGSVTGTGGSAQSIIDMQTIGAPNVAPRTLTGSVQSTWSDRSNYSTLHPGTIGTADVGDRQITGAKIADMTISGHGTSTVIGNANVPGQPNARPMILPRSIGPLDVSIDFTNAIASDIYPVGSCHITMGTYNPQTFFGGVWQRIAHGRVLVGAETGQVPGTSNVTTNNRAITAANLPEHTHTMTHTHSGPSHTHSGPSHTHSGLNHNHAAGGANTGFLRIGRAANGNIGAGTPNVTGRRIAYASGNNVRHVLAHVQNEGNFGVGEPANTQSTNPGPTSAAGTGQTGASGTGNTGAASNSTTSVAYAGSVTNFDVRQADFRVNIWTRIA